MTKAPEAECNVRLSDESKFLSMWSFVSSIVIRLPLDTSMQSGVPASRFHYHFIQKCKCVTVLSVLYLRCLFLCVFKKPVPPTVSSHSVCMLSMKVISIIDISHYFSINAENIEWLVWALLLTYWDIFFFIFRLKSAYKCIIKDDSIQRHFLLIIKAKPQGWKIQDLQTAQLNYRHDWLCHPFSVLLPPERTTCEMMKLR